MDNLLFEHKNNHPGFNKIIQGIIQQSSSDSRTKSDFGRSEGNYGVGSYGSSNFSYSPYSSMNLHPNSLVNGFN